MIKALLISIALIASLNLPAQEHTTLTSYIGKKRVLLLFAPSEEDTQLRAQQLEVEHHAKDLIDYDLAIVSMPLKAPAKDHPAHETSPADQASARKRFHILPSDFTVILLGKDGGEKLRSRQPIAFAKLAATINAMPMRQEEVRARNH